MTITRHQLYGLDTRAMKTMKNVFNEWLPSATLTWSNKTFSSCTIQNALKDASGYITHSYGTAIPTAATAGYAVGSLFNLSGASAGMCPNWINQGSATSCLFVPFGPVYGYGIKAAGARAATSGSVTEVISGEGFFNTDIALAGHIASDDDDYIASVAMTDDEGEMLITADANPLAAHGYIWAALRNMCTPDWDIVYAGEGASTAATTTALTVTGVLATDIAFVCYQATDDTDAIEKAVCTANTITVSHSATSSTGHTIGYMVLRPRGAFAPSHYIFAAGSAVATTADADGIATNSKAITGALATDIAFVVIHTQGGTIEIAAATVVAGSLTVQFSADPSTTSKFSYVVIRAY
jgi:hypothetical protein